MFDIGDVMGWCEDNAMYPNNDDDPFVLGHECSDVNEKFSFRFGLTTPLLLPLFAA